MYSEISYVEHSAWHTVITLCYWLVLSIQMLQTQNPQNDSSKRSHCGRRKSVKASPSFWQERINFWAVQFLKDLQLLRFVDISYSLCIFHVSQYPSPTVIITVKKKTFCSLTRSLLWKVNLKDMQVVFTI